MIWAQPLHNTHDIIHVMSWVLCDGCYATVLTLQHKLTVLLVSIDNQISSSLYDSFTHGRIFVLKLSIETSFLLFSLVVFAVVINKNNIEMSRFVTVTDDEVKNLLEQKDAERTRKAMEQSWRVFTSYCEEKSITFDIVILSYCVT